MKPESKTKMEAYVHGSSNCLHDISILRLQTSQLTRISASVERVTASEPMCDWIVAAFKQWYQTINTAVTFCVSVLISLIPVPLVTCQHLRLPSLGYRDPDCVSASGFVKPRSIKS